MGNTFAVEPTTQDETNMPKTPETPGPETPTPETPTPETPTPETPTPDTPTIKSETSPTTPHTAPKPKSNTIAEAAVTKVQTEMAETRARLNALAQEVRVPQDALEAYFTALNLQKMRFAQFVQQFKDRTIQHTLPIIDFTVLYKHKTLNEWVPRAPSPYKEPAGRPLSPKVRRGGAPNDPVDDSPLHHDEDESNDEENDENPFEDAPATPPNSPKTPTPEPNQPPKTPTPEPNQPPNPPHTPLIKKKVVPFRPFTQPKAKTELDDFKFREVPPAETALRAVIHLPPELSEYEPVYCAVLTDRATHVKFTIPADGLRRADESSIATLFLQAYPETCRPPGWTLSQKGSDVDRYIVDGTLLRDASTKGPEAVRAQLALEKKLAVYAVGTQSWTELARKVYLVGSTTDEADLALTRRLPCKGYVAKELQKFGYTTSGFQDAETLLPPVGVYVRTPFVGQAQADAAPAHAAVTAAQGVVDAAHAAKKADAKKPDPSPDEVRALQSAQNALVDALTPPVYSLDVINVTAPVFEKGSREYKAVLALQDREAWVLHRLEQCFDIIFFVAEHERKRVLVMPLFGSGKDFVPVGLALTYPQYFIKVLQATMALHPQVQVYFDGPETPGTRPFTFPDIIDEQSDALFVNDMGPEYVVGNCHFSDPSPNGYYGSHSAMAYLTEPAINRYISVKTLTSTPRDYTRPPPVAVPQAAQDPFTPPENAESDYVVERGTLTELAQAGDARVRDGYVPCGSVLEHDHALYQAFVRLRVDPAPLWALFEQKRHRVRSAEPKN